VAKAGEFVEFSAKGSSVPGTAAPPFEWSVSGSQLNKKPIAKCKDLSDTLRCQFMLPGGSTVAVKVTAENGLSSEAAATVIVAVPNGYLGLYSFEHRPNALRALLYDIDWIKLQTLVTRPIVLPNPDTNSPIYAVLAEPPVSTPTPPPWHGAAKGLKVIIPPLAPDARVAFETALGKIGIVPVILPAGYIAAGLSKGMSDLGFGLLDTPDALPTMPGSK
jgi:hypothetical protein